MTKVLIPWCEWDIGLAEAYSTRESFEAHARKALKNCGIKESFEELEDEGFIGADWEKVW